MLFHIMKIGKAWKDPEPKKEYDAIIIGGGGHGLAVMLI